jgi:hypothetical protein
MSTSNQPVAGTKDTSTLVRPKFGPGMLLQHDDLEQITLYTRDLSRLLFRSLMGCGVVCGLKVDTEIKCEKLHVTVDSGLALDCQGDPIHVPRKQSILLDRECTGEVPTPLWVVLCGTQKCCAPRTPVCASDEEESPSVCTRERAAFEIRIVRERPGCVCGCDEPTSNPPSQVGDEDCKCVNPAHPCYVDHYAGKCGCDCEDCQNCDCDCVLLARLERKAADQNRAVWVVDHRERRFIRPVLMRDPQVELEEIARKDEADKLSQKFASKVQAADTKGSKK